MSKGQKTVTHHTIPVITSSKIGKQYNIKGGELSETRAKLESLGYLKAIRPGSHTYELLKTCIPDTLEDLEVEYVAERFTYTLPQAYDDIKAQLADLTQEMGKKAAMGFEPDIKEKFEVAYTDLGDSLHILPDTLELTGVTFVCLPIWDDVTGKNVPLPKQRKLENLVNLLRAIRRLDLRLDEAVQLSYALEILLNVRIPSAISERMEAKCAA